MLISERRDTQENSARVKCMRRKILQIILVLLLALTVGYLIINNTESTIDKNISKFSVTDTASVTKFCFVDKQNDSVVLKRKLDFWTVNDDHIANNYKINSLLNIISKIRVREPVSKALCSYILNDINNKSIKVKVYSDDKLAKTFYVGEPTKDLFGTYMVMENTQQPFVIELPGFKGYLSVNFSSAESDWRVNNVFNTKFEDIKKVSVDNGCNVKESFIVEHTNGSVKLFDYSNSEVELFDTVKTVNFLKEFADKTFDKRVGDMSLELRDSILKSSPLYIVSVEDAGGQNHIIKTYSKPISSTVDFFGNQITSDPDTFFILMESGDLVYAQYVVYGNILKKATGFQ